MSTMSGLEREAKAYARGRMDAQRAAAEKIDELERENARLREALKPFAEKAEKDISDREFDDDIYEAVYRHEAPHLTVGDLRRARAALAGSGEK
jgi:hypothetical protein